MTLAERLHTHVAKMQSEEPLDDLGGWIAGAVILLREAADAMTPKPWPPPVGAERVLGIWDADEGEGFLDPYYWDDRWPEPVPDRWLPWPEGDTP